MRDLTYMCRVVLPKKEKKLFRKRRKIRRKRGERRKRKGKEYLESSLFYL